MERGHYEISVAVAETQGRFDLGNVQTLATPLGGAYALSGDKCWVPDAPTADWIIVPARLAGREVPLSEGEFEVLWLLATHAGQTLSRRELLRRVRGLDDHPMDRSIDNRVYRIRAKLGDEVQPAQRIRTVRNRGYVFCPTGW